MEDNLRQRAIKKLIRVTMPDGTVICHKSVTQTFINVLIAIGSAKFPLITIENSHLPLLSKEIYPKFKDWMKPVCDGWYLNAQSDTGQKYMQLSAIKKQLGIAMNVEIGTDFITSEQKVLHKKRKREDKLFVKFPNGGYVSGENPIDTFIETIWQIGPEKIKRKELIYKDKPLITLTKQFNGQVQVGQNLWIIVPGQTKDKYKLLCYINLMMKLGLEITMI